MSPRELLARIQSMGVVDEQILEKITRHMDDPEKKELKHKAILAYLVKQKQITNSQAKRLLAEIEKPQPVQHEEIVVTQKKEGFDTDDLTADVVEQVTQKTSKPTTPKSDPDATKLDTRFEPDVVQAERDFDDVIMPAADLVDPLVDPLQDPMHDPLAAADDPYQSGPQPIAAGFDGKRDNADQWSTKWLYIGFGILGSLLIVGAVLYLATSRLNAEDMFTSAVESFERGTYGDAIKKFDDFLLKFPKDEKAPVAKVRKTHSILAQVYEAKNWKETITVAEQHLPPLIEEEDIPMDLIRDDLGVILPTSALMITETALKQPDLASMERELAVARHAKSVVDDASFIPNSIRKRPNVLEKLEKIDNNIRTVEGLIKKENDYADVLIEIEKLKSENKTDAAFVAFQKITGTYGDLAARTEFQDLMKTVSAKESELVSNFDAQMSTSGNDVESIVQSSIVLASKNGSTIDGLKGEITPVFADGTLLGIDAGDGSVAWRRFLGYETVIQPQLLDEESLIVCDQRRDDVMRINLKNGQLAWRTEIGEPFVSPAVAGSMIIVTTNSGRVIKMDPSTGNVTAAIQLPQGANVGALITERRIYQPGKYSNLYVLSSDNLQCGEVYYLGHAPNSIAVPPKNWSGYILVAINGGTRCDLSILRAKSAGLELELVNTMNAVTDGPTTTPLTRFGRWMLVAADTGDIKILQLDATNDVAPITQFVSAKFENRSGQRPFYLTDGSQLWIAGKGIVKYKLQGSLGEIKRLLILNHGDSFISPMTKVGDALIHVRRRDGSGMVSVSAVDSELKEIWRTDLGGQLAGGPVPSDSGLLAISSQGDVFPLDQQSETAGYSDNAVKSSSVIQNLLFDTIIDLSPTSHVCVSADGRSDFLYIDSQAGTSQLMRFKAPADKPAARPISVDGDIVVASETGQVVRVNPKTGAMIGTPFQPPIRPGVKMKWVSPVALAPAVFAIATKPNESGNGTVYVLDARNKNSIVELAKLDAAVVSDLAGSGSSVFAVIRGDAGEKLVAIDGSQKLAETASVQLPSAVRAGPWVVGDNLLVALDTDELVCLGLDLKKKWSTELPADKFASPPMAAGNSIMLAFQNGQVQMLSQQDGQAANNLDLKQPIIHAPLQKDNRLYFGGLDGTVHVVNVN